MKIGVRCDGNDNVGMGHLIRCICLSVDLGVESIFIGSYNQIARQLLIKNNLKFIDVNEEVSFDSKLIESFAIDFSFIIFDSYNLNDSNTSETFKYPWVIFDDENNSVFPNAEAVINFRINAEKLFKYSARKSFLGIKYMPIEKSFVEIRKKNLLQTKSEINNVLVFVGGSDIYQKGFELLKGVFNYNNELNISFLSNDIFTDSSEILSKKNISSLPFTDNLSALLENIDLAIVGGGRVKYELGFCCIPTLSYSQTNLQLEDSAILEKYSLLFNGGMIKNITSQKVENDISSLLETKTISEINESMSKVYRTDSNRLLANEIIQTMALT